MGFGLPVEGEKGPFVGSALIDVPTCGPDEAASDVADRLVEAGEDRAAVVTERIPVGLVHLDDLRSDDEDGAGVRDRMELIPDTIRPSVEVSRLDEKTARRLVTLPNGVLLGAVDPAAIHHLHEVEHDAMELIDDIAERFGEREPSQRELCAFLRDRLVARGHSPEVAERILAEMDMSG
jgi:hypothetical protein